MSLHFIGRFLFYDRKRCQHDQNGNGIVALISILLLFLLCFRWKYSQRASDFDLVIFDYIECDYRKSVNENQAYYDDDHNNAFYLSPTQFSLINNCINSMYMSLYKTNFTDPSTARPLLGS